MSAEKPGNSGRIKSADEVVEHPAGGPISTPDTTKQPGAPMAERHSTSDLPQAGQTIHCEHFYGWVSPAGSSHAARLCIGCSQPDPDWLNQIIDPSRVPPAIATEASEGPS